MREHQAVARRVRILIGVDDDGYRIRSGDPCHEPDRGVGIATDIGALPGEVQTHGTVGARAAEREENDAPTGREAGERGDDAEECGGIGGAENCGHPESVHVGGADGRGKGGLWTQIL